MTYLNIVPARVVNGPTSSGPKPARTRKLIWSPNHTRKKPKVKLSLKNLLMLPSYFDHIFVHLRQKVCLRPESSPKFLSTLGPNPARTRPEKPGLTCNSGACCFLIFLQRPKCVAHCFFLLSHIDCPILPTSNLCLVFFKFVLKSYSPELKYSCQHAVAVNS